MNKKFLSAILFGALMVTSTGTFVSCKDYDDDIEELRNEINGQKSDLNTKVTAIETSIASLQSAQSSLDSKIAAAQSAAEKAALEAQKAAIAAAAEELAATKAELKSLIDSNVKEAEALKAADAKAAEEMAKVVGRIQTLEAFKTTTEETLTKLAQADAALQKNIDGLDAKIAENAVQIGKNAAAIEAQIEALNNYKKAGEANAAAIEQLVKDLEALSEGQLTEAKVTEIAAKVTEKLGAKLDLISAAFNKKVTHISLADMSNVNNYYKWLDLVSAKAITDYKFGEGMEGGPVVFKKDNVETFEDQILLRVSPANAVLDKDMIKLVNSQMKDLAGLVNIIDVKPYKGLLTSSRGVSENGLWTITVKLIDNFDQNTYWNAAISNGNYINYAVMVGDSLKDERQIISDYALCLSTWNKEAEHVLNFYVNGKPVNEIKNRYNGTNRTGTENGGVTKYEEAAWNVKWHDIAVAPGKEYDFAPFITPNWTAFAQGNVNANIRRANLNLTDWHESTDDVKHNIYDVRHDLQALRVDAGKPFTVNFKGSFYNEAVRAYYVTLDEVNAVESQPSELNAWKSYKIQGLNKIVNGKEALELTIPAEAGAEGDYIGFRVYAVNYDGTLIDPDGRAFYVYVGEQNTVSATVSLSMESKVIAPLATTVSTPTNAYQPFSTEAWGNARGGKYTLTVYEDAISSNNIAEDFVVDYSNFVFKNSQNAEVPLLKADGSLIGDATDIYDDKIATITKVGMKNVKAANLKDGKTYIAQLVIKGKNAAVLAVANISFSKTLPGFPTNVAPTTGMLQDGNVMVFPTPAQDKAASFPMTSAWEGLVPALNLTWEGVKSINADLYNSITYDRRQFYLTVENKYLKPDNANYAKKLPMVYGYNYGPISYPYNAYTHDWDKDQDWITTSAFTLQFGNYVHESSLAMDEGIAITYPGAAGKQSALPLDKLNMTDWYGEAINLKSVLANQMTGKEAKYIQSAEVVFVTANTAKPENEFYKYGYLGKAQYDNKGEFARYTKLGDYYYEFDEKGNQTKKYKLELKHCDVLVMESVKDATTGNVAPTKIRIKFTDTFGYTIVKTTATSFEMNFKQN